MPSTRRIRVSLTALTMTVAAMSARTDAALINFIYTGTGAGSLNGVNFNASAFTINCVANTQSWDYLLPGVASVDHVSSSITIAGLGTYSTIPQTRTFIVESTGTIGFGLIGYDLFNLMNGNPGLVGWDKVSSIGPVSNATSLLTQWGSPNPPVNTSGGGLVFNSDNMVAGTFEASTVPAPGAFALIGAVAALGQRRRR